MTHKLRVAVVGVGHLGSVHAAIYARMPEVELVGVVDVDVSTAERVASECRCEILAPGASLSGQVDAVSVAVPTSRHKEVAEPILADGIPVLLEKPVAHSLEDARAIVEGALSSGTILLIGHDGHDEVIGTMGEAPEAILLIESPQDVDELELPDDTRLAYLTQTTLSVDDANCIIEKIKQRFPQVEGPPREDICYATQNRQEAVRKLAEEADVVLVLGSQNSSNSQRLKELAQEYGKPTYLIDGARDLQESWFGANDRVLVTAGASAPESVVEECIEFLQQHFGAELQERTIRQEEVHFVLPRELRDVIGQ